MKATKSWFVEHGLGELGLSGAVYDMTPEDKERIAERLDANLAELESKGARVSGWVYANGPGIANLNTEVDIPWADVNLVILSAAIVAAPSIGKNLSSVTVTQLMLARDNLMYFGKTIPQMQRSSNMPLGSGNQRVADGVQFYTPRQPRLSAGPDEDFDNPTLDILSNEVTFKGSQ